MTTSNLRGSDGNLRGILLMVFAMFGFAIEDMFIKFLAVRMPTGQILMVLGAGGAIGFVIVAWVRRDPFPLAAFFHPMILIRNASEVVGTIGFITALALAPLSTVSAIIQANPLVVAMGAALFLGEPVGWRRWLAILVGLSGVILVIQPWGEAFVPASLFAILAVMGLSARDLATRNVPGHIPTAVLAAFTLSVLVPTGAVMLALPGTLPAIWPTPLEALYLAICVTIGVAAYYAITAAMRVGEVGVVTPFRYSRIVFALIIAALIFGERFDPLTILGAIIVVSTGLYTLWRERKVKAALTHA